MLDGGKVTVYVQCDKGTVWGDPEVPGQRAHVHGSVRREWRHLDTCQLETRIVAEVPRLKYNSGRVEEVTVPWAERYSRITRLMEGFVLQLLVAASNVKRVASLLRLDWHTVNAVIKRAVERGMMVRVHTSSKRIMRAIERADSIVLTWLQRRLRSSHSAAIAEWLSKSSVSSSVMKPRARCAVSMFFGVPVRKVQFASMACSFL